MCGCVFLFWILLCYECIKCSMLLTFIAITAAVGNTFVLFILHPVRFTCQACVAATSGTSNRTLHALLTLFIAKEAIWTCVEAFTFIGKSVGTTQDTL